MTIQGGGTENIDPLLLNGSFSPRPTRESHPNIRFWTLADYLKWFNNSPEAQAGVHGRVDYLEHKDGSGVSPDTLAVIRQTMRNGWTTLAKCDLAPQSWGQIDAMGHQKFRVLVENAHPLFQFADNGWKLDHLATSMYPSWAKHTLATT
ncbi:hypothetical protein PAXRUDRAFT_181779 [Paxillus rubicundulus Ve08.2h10]|uniref:Unplaced genomic scaffold scaffold_6787, whole genome shotgun sequence n=1 Tax=Paxillus rubicundulus Ve08.2h10 TaxID=930991 RepID=A0A0D0CWY2_9AGAM|nr:hypothetical protein PAXRUDRAFT_181779 [Paxillus rubicundulus Ve08.2h10]